MNEQNIMLAGEIGSGTNRPHELAWALAEKPGAIGLASPGGDLLAGLAMAEQVRKAGRDVVALYAGSAAVPILLAGKRRTLATDGFVLIHAGWTLSGGNAARMRQHADWLEARDRTYAEAIVARSRAPAEIVANWMEGETYLTAAEALEWGLVDELAEGLESIAPPRASEDYAQMHRQAAQSEKHAARTVQPEATAQALASYQGAAWDAMLSHPRADGLPSNPATLAAAAECARWTRAALNRHRDQGTDLPSRPWAGRWPCPSCCVFNYHPPFRADNSPANCAFCEHPKRKIS